VAAFDADIFKNGHYGSPVNYRAFQPKPNSNNKIGIDGVNVKTVGSLRSAVCSTAFGSGIRWEKGGVYSRGEPFAYAQNTVVC